MKLDPATIEALITQSIPDAQLYMEDIRGDGRHLALSVISSSFEGLTLLQQHQTVYSALGMHAAVIVESITLYTAAPVSACRTGTGG